MLVALTLTSQAEAQFSDAGADADASVPFVEDGGIEDSGIEDSGATDADNAYCQATDTEAETPLRAADCPALFGDANSRALHHQRRRQVLQSAEQGEFCIELVHHTNWKQPRRAKLGGIELLATRHPSPCPATAEIDIDAAQLGLDCPSGVYEIKVDESLGDSGQVLAIFADVVLLEFGGDLFYLSDRVNLRPSWRLTWQSGWSYALPEAAHASGKKRKSRGKKKRPHPKARKRASKRR